MIKALVYCTTLRQQLLKTYPCFILREYHGYANMTQHENNERSNQLNTKKQDTTSNLKSYQQNY